MNSKCRLCLCSVGKPKEFTATLADDGFSEMLQTVFRFPLPAVQTVRGKSCNLPDKVCLQCFTTVRNFYSFTKLTEASQKKLQKECMAKATFSSLAELVEYVKAKPDIGTDPTDVFDDGVEHLSPWPAACTSTKNSSKCLKRITDQERSWSYSLSPFNQATQDGSEECSSHGCVDREEVADSISNVEKSINMISKKVDTMLKTVASTAKKSFRARFSSFEMNPINSENELASFNNQLKEKEFKDKVLDWLDASVSAFDSANRMHQTIDLIFSKTFFAECNWTGRNNKASIAKYCNVVELFGIIGGTNTGTINYIGIKRFLRGKFRHSKQRINLQARTTSCHRNRL